MSPDVAPGGFGAKLRQARERRGLSLRDLANATKISLGALDALENNDVTRLPGGIFSRAFVRAYATEVGLDPEAAIQEFAAQFAHDPAAVAPRPAAKSEDDEMIESNQQVASIVLKLLLVSIPIAGAVLYFVMTGRPGSSVRASESSGDAAPPAAAAQPSLAAEDRVTATVSAVGSSSVVATVDGRQVLSSQLRPGDRHELGPAETIELIIGDPTAVTVSVNGSPTRPLGPAGQPTTVRLTRTTLREFLPPQ